MAYALREKSGRSYALPRPKPSRIFILKGGESMILGERLRQLREEKNLSQGDIEHKTGLLRCYISRVENGHTVPSVETLEKLSRAMDMELWQIFATPEQEPPKKLGSVVARDKERHIAPFMVFLPKLSPRDRATLLRVASSMARAKTRIAA